VAGVGVTGAAGEHGWDGALGGLGRGWQVLGNANTSGLEGVKGNGLCEVGAGRGVGSSEGLGNAASVRGKGGLPHSTTGQVCARTA
jgi:hypothetical protein